MKRGLEPARTKAGLNQDFFFIIHSWSTIKWTEDDYVRLINIVIKKNNFQSSLLEYTEYYTELKTFYGDFSIILTKLKKQL